MTKRFDFQRMIMAAETLRSLVGKLTTDSARWDEAFPSLNVYADTSTYERMIFHPAIAVALADEIEQTARQVAGTTDGYWSYTDDWPMGKIVDMILGNEERHLE